MLRLFQLATLAALALVWSACWSAGSPLPPAPLPTVARATATPVPPAPEIVAATRQAAERIRLREQHGELLQRSAVAPGDFNPQGHLLGSVQQAQRDRARAAAARDAGLIPRTAPDPPQFVRPYWYRDGAGDLTPPGVNSPYADLLPPARACAPYSALADGPRRNDFYRELYRHVAELLPVSPPSQDDFLAQTQEQLAWELLPGPGPDVRLRLWLTFRHDGGRYLIGGEALGALEDVDHVRCPVFGSFDHQSVELARLE